ncbi:alpha/beta fold hydrolase [Streptosporangium amethystogenes]|uniref:alpha/beta fold hydrolase n=1 Tax=Streptosporangium amethystogenes TaxID=2002 RepID=UPI00378C8FFC
MISRTISLTGQTVHLVDVPASADEHRTPLVLLHGGAVDHRMWSPQLAAFPERRVIAPDARGHGDSSDADAEAPYRLADDVVAVLDALDIDRAVLAGVSMGGGTAVDIALEYPDRCAALVVSGTGTSEPTFTDRWSLDAFGAWRRAEAEGDAEAWIEVFMRFTHGPYRDRGDVDLAIDALIERMARDTLGHLRFDDHGTPLPPTPPTPVTRTWKRANRIQVPVLALNGALDGPDHRENGRRLAGVVPHGAYAEIDGAAHYANLEEPTEYARAIQDFLRAHEL